MRTRQYSAFILGIFVIPLALLLGGFSEQASANTEVQKLQQQINDRNSRLNEIQREIAEYEKALQEVGAERNTLERAISQLELERNKIQADIRLTQNKIESTDLTIERLSYDIDQTESAIERSEETIRNIIRRMNISNTDSLIEILLRHNNIAEFWTTLETLDTVRHGVSDRIQELIQLKDDLENNRIQNSRQREQLESLRSQYSAQQNILTSNRQEKSQLLSATRNEESAYQQMLRDRESARDRLFAEVREIESQIQFVLNPSTIPPKGTAVFIWPLNDVRITQRFGYTQFAASGAYGGNQHNGVDFGAPIGTNLFAPLTGTVRNIGDTDQVPGCFSWGKWLLIDHPNGLSSMFAHLSHISVQPGQRVNTGDIVGHVGSTGYSTGPHLHYTLYVTKGVQVMAFNQFKTVTGCGAALSPFAGIEAYLDPLDYLPPL